MDGELNWNGEKKDLRNLSIKDLQDKLLELRKLRMKLETERFTHYSLDKKKAKGGNLKKIKKTIAFVKTIIGEKS